MASGVGTALMIAAVGLSTLGGLQLGAGPTADRVAVFTPRSQDNGMAWAGTLALPIVDLLFGGRVVILDLTSAPRALERLRNMGLFLLDASVVTGCLGAKIL